MISVGFQLAGRPWIAKLCRNVLGGKSLLDISTCFVLHLAREDALKGRSYQTEAVGMNRQRVTGLYGYDVLKSANGFQAFAQAAIEKSEELIDRIKQSPPSMETIRLFDDLSDTICTVVDSAELCRNTHPDLDFVQEASQASMKMYEYLHRLNSNTILYHAIIKVEQSGTLTTEEAKRAAQSLRVEFERGGIHLPEEKLERVHELNLRVTQLGREFVENILKDPGHVDIFPASKVPKCIQQMIKPIFRSKDGTLAEFPKGGRSTRGFESGVRVFTEAENLSTILKWARDRELRKQAYMEGYSVPKANLRVIDGLIAARHELSQLLGYQSFAHFAVAPTLAGSPDVVKSFLMDLSEKIRGKADEELKMLERFGKDVEGACFNAVNAWDEAYYTGLMKAQTLDLNARVVASYFPLAQCIEGLKLITKSLFGAVLKQVPLARGEAWHPDVAKYTLHHSLEGDLGYLYLDLYARKGKFPGSAHFAIRGGRRLAVNDYQLPVVALVCNFSTHASSCPILNHWEVETLFHEFGHALHSLLTRTDYQHFSGTRTALDFVETPSNLFEYYAWDYRVLTRFARHYATGEPIPVKMVEAMNKAKNLFAATELQRQVLYAMIDQNLFGDQPLPAKDSTSIIASLKHQHTSLKHVEGTHWHTRFNHLVTYGAGYYSYLFARCFAATIWHKVCMGDPLSLETGEILRTSLLQHGGGKDPALMIKECAGEEALVSCSNGGVKPTIVSLFSELGY